MPKKALSHVPHRPVTEAALAALFGVDRRTVSRWVKAGMPATKRGRALAIDLAAAIRWVRDRDAQAAEERLEAVRATPDLDAARARKLTAEATMAELLLAEKQNELVSAQAAEDREARRVGAARERLLILAPVAVQKGLIAPEREASLQGLVDEALAELADRGAA